MVLDAVHTTSGRASILFFFLRGGRGGQLPKATVEELLAGGGAIVSTGSAGTDEENRYCGAAGAGINRTEQDRASWYWEHPVFEIKTLTGIPAGILILLNKL